MSFAEPLAAAVAAATTYTQINAAAAALWKAHGAGLIDDTTAQTTAEALQARKVLIGGRGTGRASKPHHRLPRRSPRSPDREASVRRRRSCAASGAVPSTIAAAFTTAELAVLSVIAAEVRRAGSCSWPVDRIAALAGVCRRTAQYALRRAAALGLVQIEERPRPGQKHLPSLITVVSPEWRAWLRHRVQKAAHHENMGINPVYADRNGWTRSSSVPIMTGATSTKGPSCIPTPPRSPSAPPPKG
jgi:hypothetical protein